MPQPQKYICCKKSKDLCAFFALLLATIQLLPAQLFAKKKNSTDPGIIETPRLTFWRTGLFYESGRTKGPGINDPTGGSAGFEINVCPRYEGQDDEAKTNIGWCLDLAMGWNFKGKNLAPYQFDIGFWGGHLVGDNIEIGWKYCFLGIYGYQEIAQFGSLLAPAVRVGSFQATLGRAGEGAVFGCFKPKNPKDLSAQHYFELAYLSKIGFIFGIRNTQYRISDRNTSEMRFFISLNAGESYRRTVKK